MPPSIEESLRAPVPRAAVEDASHPPQLQEQIGKLISESADPERVARYFAEFASRHSDTLQSLAAPPAERILWLATIFRFSAFLSDECLRHPEWILEITGIERPSSAVDYHVRLKKFVAATGHASALDLSLFRRKELLRIVIRDGLALASVAELTQEISNLADAILGFALESVTLELQERYGRPLLRGASGEIIPAVFAVLALGKLGGHELNYSSDIDLMFLYSGNGETSGPTIVTNGEFFKKVANQFTNLLSTYTAAGVCYRVDLRLRPEGSLGEICLSLTGAKDYYAKRARDWELQMLIKARTAAGDAALGQELLNFLEPFIYSTSLDFTTIETMSATRERMGEKLARRRLRQDRFDVKLARGGIRDIEFLVQCLQRLHGARDSSVRHGGTLFALSSLLEKDLLSESEHARLSSAYQFLRNLEHRLQLEDDRQTHALPSDPRALERIAARMPGAHNGPPSQIGSSAQLLQTLNQHLENVQVIYERIVHAQRPLFYTPTLAAVPVSVAPEEHAAETRTPIPLTTASKSVEQLAPRFAALTQSLGFRRSGHVLENFVESAAEDPHHLHLIETHPKLAGYVLQILDLSPFLSEQLTRHPDLLAEVRLVADHPAMRPAFEAMAAPLNDIDGLRRFFQREMFRILAGSICLPESVFQTLDRTSGLAEFLIARAYRIALEQGLAHARAHTAAEKCFDDPEEQMMVVALGRLGMREFDLGSDADLLFIIPDAELSRQQFWTRVAEHMIEILTDYGVDGPILSLDTRLRPNGREGVLVQTESNYVDYFSKHAEAWEGIAYMKARGVAGDLERATTFLTQLQQVDWRRYGQSGRSRQDLRQMRMRLQREQGALTPLKAAEGGYYDADFILMYLRLKGAGLFFKSLNTPERIDIVEKMGHLERAHAEFLLEATTFFRAVDHATRIVSGRAEEKLPGATPEREMVADLVQLWTNKRPVAATLDEELVTLQHKMRRLFDGVFQ
jgi:[glutamine synthetase] adenylyltransferase / [glutamine synthetase]-adenylyl-L-tyrosine phosphorylase